MGELNPLLFNDGAGGQNDALEQRLQRLERHLARERAARLEAEAIAESGLRDLYESKQRLSLLQKVTDLANRSMDVQATVVVTLSEICSAMGWDVACAWSVGEDRLLHACEIWSQPGIDSLEDFLAVTGNATLAPGQGLPGITLSRTAPNWVRRLESYDEDPRVEAMKRAKLVSACAFPVMLDREPLAILEFYSRHATAGSEDVDTIMMQIGNQLAQVVERQRSWRSLQSAKHDELTGLPSRAILAERSRATFAEMEGDRKGMAMLVLDLNGFKAVNDRHGHFFGDQILAKVAKRLRRKLSRWTLEQPDGCDPLLARTGGDEFVVMLGGLTDPEQVEMLAAQLHVAFSRPFDVDGVLVTMGTSIGAAGSDDSYADVDALMRDADLAMYQAKKLGQNQTVIFTPELGSQIRERRQLEQELREAIGAGQFVLHYQPIYSLQSDGALRGFEALVRWHHPRRGLLPPAEFIAVAEQIGVISPIGQWVLEEACNAIARMPDDLGEPGKPPFVSVNVAPDQFLQCSFLDQMRGAIMRSAIRPERLRIEITENVAIMDARQTADILSEMRSWGVQTSLDDFGTGYSSLSYLQNLPLDSFKIDQSFVSSLDQQRSRNIIRAMCDLARQIKLSIVAEGIETSTQAERLARLGCHHGQGFLFGRPLPESMAFAHSSRWSGHRRRA